MEHESLYYGNVFAMTFGFGLDVQCRNLLGFQIKLRSYGQVFPSTLANKSVSLFFLCPFALEAAAELDEKRRQLYTSSLSLVPFWWWVATNAGLKEMMDARPKGRG